MAFGDEERTMEEVTNERRRARRNLTKKAEQIETEAAEDNPDGALLLSLGSDLDEIQEVISACNTQVNILYGANPVPEDEENKEIDECQTFSLIYHKARAKIVPYIEQQLERERARRPPSPKKEKNNDETQSTLKMPEFKVPTFSGEHRDWLSFWGSFSRVHDNKKMTTADKFACLEQAMKPNTRAQRVVEKFLGMPENYPKAVKALEERFGNRDFLIDEYVRELQGLMIQNALNRSGKDRISLTDLYDKIEVSLNALDTLGTIDKCQFLYPMVESCLPIPVQRAWHRSALSKEQAGEPGEEKQSKLDRLLQFLALEVDGETKIEHASRGYGGSEKKQEEKKPAPEKNNGFKGKGKGKDHPPTAMGLVAMDTKAKCIFCDKEDHKSQNCFAAAKVPVAERKKVVQGGRYCWKCLHKGHVSKECKEKVTCSKCNRSHYEILCDTPTTQAMNAVPPPIQFQPALFPAYAAQQPPPKQEHNCANMHCNRDVLLPTIVVGVKDIIGKLRRVRAAIDTMSGHSYITKNVVQDFGITPSSKATFMHSVFGGAMQEVEHLKYPLKLYSLAGSYSCTADVYDQERIASGIPGIPPEQVLRELRVYGIVLSEESQRNRPVDLLIGADIAGKILTGRQFQLRSGPTAVETQFGWTVMGQPIALTGERSGFMEHTLVNLPYPTSMWELEAIGIQDSAEKLSKAEEDEASMEHFRRTVTRKEDGRYQVSLPWVDGHPPLHSNRRIAEKRLENVIRKLEQQNKYDDYDAVFEKWLHEGIISEVEPEFPEEGHYLPHRPVFKPGSATTKVRPVFDASCRGFYNGKETASLNDCLAPGPNLMDQIPNIHLRFREDEEAAEADIEGAFCQIELAENDKKFFRFLWPTPDRSRLRVLQHNRVTFGAKCSPFLLMAVIETHLRRWKVKQDAEVIRKLSKCLYVDNVVPSFPNTGVYEHFKHRSIEIFKDAKMNLRQWESTMDAEIGPDPTGVLGMQWDGVRDEMFCSPLEEFESKKITKKTLLSAIARVYDPLGMLAPVVLVPKIMLQQCWDEKLKWDTEVPEEMQKSFRVWLEEMSAIEEARIPRCIGVPTEESSLHIFCDASFSGYAAVAFLRLVKGDSVSAKFIMCRSRVAPLKKTTINRVELISCEIGVRLAETILEALEWRGIKVVYWTDSTTAHAWIKRDRDWNTFVGNRVRKIREKTDAEDWRHVPGLLNPADLPSRGCGLQKLMELNWWKGPAWLLKEESEWPGANPDCDEDLVEAELKKAAISAVNMLVEEPWWSPKLRRLGSFRDLLRVVGWMQRFRNNCTKSKEERQTGDLTFEEIVEAERCMFRIIQRESDVDLKSLPFQTKIFRDGLVRVETKLAFRDDTTSFKYPVVLSGKHHLTQLLIQQEHHVNGHPGVQFLLSTLRERVWIVGGRVAVRKVVGDCFRCKRFTAAPIEPEAAPLPENRIKDAVPFEVTGVDFAGPLYPRSEKQCWVALFTCGVYRAVHFELVDSLSSEAFLQTMRKFIARRGRPSVIYSDNGTNFKGARNELRRIDWSIIEKDARVGPIKWIFNPPAAPWFGGFFERMVRSMKELLVRNLQNKVLSKNELSVVLCDIESVINRRPLTYVYENDTFVPLTPALFLQGPRESGVPDLDALERTDLRKRLIHRNRVMENLRERFRREYLGQLVQRRNNAKEWSLRVGDVVLVGADNVKRAFWPMGVVQEIQGRVAMVRTEKGVIARALQRLYPMELSSQEERLSPERVRQAIKTRAGRSIRRPAEYND